MNFLDKLNSITENSAFTRDCTVGGIKVRVKLLSFSDEKKLSILIEEMSSNLEDMAVMNEWKKCVVSFAIDSIDDTKVPEFIELTDGSKTSKSVYLKDFLDKSPTKIINTLFQVYTDLKEESEASIDRGLVCNWFKDPITRAAEAEAGEGSNPELVPVEEGDDEEYDESTHGEGNPDDDQEEERVHLNRVP